MSSNSPDTPTATCTTSWRICRRCVRVKPAMRNLEFGIWNASRVRRMNDSQSLNFTFLIVGTALLFGCVALAQEAADGWKTYHGDNTGQRHSRLTQITPANVHQVTLVWAFATGDTSQIKGTPIVSDGIVYVTTPDNVWAIGASAVALLLSRERGVSHRPSRRRGLQGLRLLHHSGRPPGGARRPHRQGEVERGDRRPEERLLVDERAAADS